LKKKDKKASIAFIKDETVPRNDVYKSHTVHVPSGESPTSKSRPPAKRKAGVVRPITSGKLLRPTDVNHLNALALFYAHLRAFRANPSQLQNRSRSLKRSQGKAASHPISHLLSFNPPYLKRLQTMQLPDQGARLQRLLRHLLRVPPRLNRNSHSIGRFTISVGKKASCR
jgi:hypothetical protein